VKVGWEEVPLWMLLKKSDESVKLQPEQIYKEVTIRIKGKGIVLRREARGSEMAAERRSVVRTGQFILSKIDARNGAFGLVPSSLEGAVVSNDFPTFTINIERLEPRFLEWLSKTASFVELCKAASEGTTNRVRLAESRFLQMTIAVPPLEEQKRIVARVERLMAKVDEARGLREQIAKLAYASLLGTYHRLVSGAPHMLMCDVAPLVRRSVEVVPEGRYAEMGVRSFGKGTFAKPILSGVEIGDKRLFYIKPNDLVFNIVFAWEGAVAIAKQEDEGRVGSHRFLTCVPKEHLATSAFLNFHFSTREGLEQLQSASPGGAGRNRTLGLKALEQIRVPIPAFEKQVWFSAQLHRLTQISQLQTQSQLELDALPASILARAFAGEL